MLATARPSCFMFYDLPLVTSSSWYKKTANAGNQMATVEKLPQRRTVAVGGRPSCIRQQRHFVYSCDHEIRDT